jgi:RNA:NAD 2'-phosphotransferase (TPT1/KptA family)
MSSKADPEPNIGMSRMLSLLLRHQLKQVARTVPKDGYVPLDAVLQFLRRKGFPGASVEDVKLIVRLCASLLKKNALHACILNCM